MSVVQGGQGVQGVQGKDSGEGIQEPGGCRSGERANGGEPLWIVPNDLALFLSSVRKAEIGVKRAAPGNYRTRFSLAYRSEIIHPRNAPIPATR